MGHIPYDNTFAEAALKNYSLSWGALWKHRAEIVRCLDELYNEFLDEGAMFTRL